MKKIIFVIVIVVVLYLVAYVYFGGFPVGYQSGHLIIYKYTCGDLCPQYGYWSKKFTGKISETECTQIGGQPEYVTYAGVVKHGYNGCSPR